jgi:hypothetical protein
MPEIPSCPNAKEGTCPRSDTFVEGERHNCFVIRCRTCKSINVWPFDNEDNKGRYEAFLRRKMEQEAKVRAAGQRTIYSK